MAGPTLSQILDSPRPTTTSRRQDQNPLPSPYSAANSPASLHHPRLGLHHQRSLPPPSPVPGLQPSNTRKLGPAPVTLPPPNAATTATPGINARTSSVPTSSVLQVRPAPTPPAATPPLPTPVSGPLPGPEPTVATVSRSSGDAGYPAAPYAHGRPSIDQAVSPDGSPAATTSNAPANNHRGHNLYACRDCGRSYSRPEHLVRHVQTHTLGRRFVCDICQKSFARKDLLRRHVANHANDSPKKRRRTTAPGTGRVSHACQACASARVKCDDNKPCKRCVTRNLTCVSTEAPSTAAMHLMHLAHSSAGSGPQGEGLPVPADPANASRGSHSPGPLAYSQPRSMPSEAVQDPPLALQHHHPQYPYARHSATPSSAPSRSPQLKLSSHEPNYYPYTPLPEELEPAASAMDQSRLPFAAFLRLVVGPEATADLASCGPTQGLKVLDYCDYASLDLVDEDFGRLERWNAEGSYGLAASQQQVQGSRFSATTYGVEAPNDAAQARQGLVSMWTNSRSPEPRSQEGGARNTTTTGGSESVSDSRGRFAERVTSDRLESSARDRILAMVLNTTRQSIITARLAASFPSVDILDLLIQEFLAALSGQASEWVHFPTFWLNAQSPEWLAAGAAAGACLSPIPTMRNFGFLLQDAARGTLPAQLADGPAAMQDIALIQAFVLVQEMGLWSGNRARMELAQSHLTIPVTLMRNRNKFQGYSYQNVAVEPNDEGPELERKWRTWITRERWKRLVFHCFLQDARVSMVTLTNPSMSYAELMLPLPDPREVWSARSASEWKAEYLQRMEGVDESPRPSLADVFHDINLLSGSGLGVDMQFSVSIYLHGFWAMILEYRRLSAVHRPRAYSRSASMGAGQSQSLLLGSRHQELVRELQSFYLMTQELDEMTTHEHLMLHMLNMHLHVSLDDVQLFAGKEGVDQARRIYPTLQQWAVSSEARTAIWCAGQVLRYAKAFAPGDLRDFDAVAVEHAGLVLWTYAVVNTSISDAPRPRLQQQSADKVYLDGAETAATQKFVTFGQGKPMVRGPVVRDTVFEAWAEDAQACMGVAQEVIAGNYKDVKESIPPMVLNLCTVMQQMGEAAGAHKERTI